jgi:two-component system, NarL family, response regulator
MAQESPITVLVVDDHPVVRDGLRAMISSEPDMNVVGDVGTGREAVDSYFELRPAVVLMDLRLPDMSGTEAIRQICLRSKAAQILVLTTVDGDEEIYRALEAGARGYLLKDMVRRELVQAIREVHQGRRYIPAAVGVRIAENLPRPGVTAREVEVLQLLASGLRNKEIAHRLEVSESTVNAHIKHVLAKLQVTERAHAVTVALRRGIIRL